MSVTAITGFTITIRQFRVIVAFPLLLLTCKCEGFLLTKGAGCTDLSDFLDGDFVSIKDRKIGDCPRQCVVQFKGIITPLCTREDNVETDPFDLPHEYENCFWTRLELALQWSATEKSLRGGPGYGAQASVIWSITEETLALLKADNVVIPGSSMAKRLKEFLLMIYEVMPLYIGLQPRLHTTGTLYQRNFNKSVFVHMFDFLRIIFIKQRIAAISCLVLVRV